MPGAKRKCDEDTWIVTQSKKFKCGTLLSNVYATTLAQLRLGARNFFKVTATGGGSQSNNVDGSSQPPASPTTPIMGLISSPPGSPLIRDLISDDDIIELSPNLGNVAKPHASDICHSCSFKRDGWEKCYYCEKVVCHLNSCIGCEYGFCSNCSITKYDNPDGESYACYACLR